MIIKSLILPQVTFLFPRLQRLFLKHKKENIQLNKPEINTRIIKISDGGLIMPQILSEKRMIIKYNYEILTRKLKEITI